MPTLEKPALQVALDEMILARALKMAEESVEGGVDWLEAGTPLIKSEGMNALREIKSRFPNKTPVSYTHLTLPTN